MIFVAIILAANFGRAELLGDDWPMLAHDPQRSGGSSNELRPPFARKWHRLFPDDGIQSGVEPIISGGKLFIGTLAGSLQALDTETGKDLWTFGTGGPILHTAASDGTNICLCRD